MNRKIDAIHYQLQQQLKATAEALPGNGSSPIAASTLAADTLLHELRVHQMELEAHNEELRRAQLILEKSREHYAKLYDFAPIGYLTLNAEGLVDDINFTGEKLLGVDRKQIVTKRFANFIANQDVDNWYFQFVCAMKGMEGEKHSFDLLVNRGEGASFYGQFNCRRSQNDSLSPILLITLADITQLKQAELMRVTATAFEAQVGIFICDANRVILQANPACSKISGYGAQEMIGQKPNLFNSLRHDPEFYEAIWETVRLAGTWQGEVYHCRKNGESFPCALTITAIPSDSSNTAVNYVATLTDISEQKAAYEQIEQLAFYDPLTQLPNRRLLKDRLHLALVHSTRNKQYGVLLFIDLDNFKTLNDTLGHKAGDLLLQQVAQRLLGCVREGDTAVRLGGDEFVVMMEDLSEQSEEAAINAEIASKKILATLHEPYEFEGREFTCTASIGATLFYGHTVAEDDLLKHVDMAMYKAKNAGRDRLCFFDQTMQSTLLERTALEKDLRLALERQQFKLHYQIQATHTEQVVGAEVLLRWQHPERGLLLATEFIPLAEETDLILPIGRWVLEAACQQLKVWESQPHTQDLQLAVNVSAKQFQQPDFVEQLRSILEKTGIDPQRLKLELTEGIIIKNLEDAAFKMKKLKKLGVSLAMDDFGTGINSLEYLTKLPLDQLKIDQGFVRNLSISRSDEIIAQTIIGMASHLGLEIIAKGVETEAQRLFLEEHGCLLYQGYLFSIPVGLKKVEALISAAA